MIERVGEYDKDLKGILERKGNYRKVGFLTKRVERSSRENLQEKERYNGNGRV